MKVLIINAPSHRGTTYRIARMTAEKITSGKNIDEIFLPRDFGEFCCGCGKCFMESEKKCPHYAKLKPVTEKIDSADVLIFACPTYVFHMAGQMKALLDHYAYRWLVHRPDERMFGKTAVIISTAAGTGTKPAIKDIADSCFFWGIQRVYKYGINVHAVSWKDVSDRKKRAISKKTSEIAQMVRSEKDRTPFSAKTRIFFNVMGMVQRKKGFSEADKIYWNEKGWTRGVKPWD